MIGRRFFIISDVHLSASSDGMMSNPTHLARFVEQLDAHSSSADLIIAGDFVDFLAVEPYASWTRDPKVATEKLKCVAKSHAAPVFDALGRLLASGRRLYVIVGNHDLEFALRGVQAELRTLLSAGDGVHFIDDGSAFCCGRLLVEHGNRYDAANRNDWGGVRAVRSAQSRGEDPPSLRVSAGSEIVQRIVNPLLARYPFVNLLQPEGPLTLLLLLAFEPALRRNWRALGRVIAAAYCQRRDARGDVPGTTSEVSAPVVLPLQVEGFENDIADLFAPPEEVAMAPWIDIAFTAGGTGGVADMIRAGTPVPDGQLKRIQSVVRYLVQDDPFADPEGSTGAYGRAAERLRRNGFDTVIMGHTHLARRIGNEERPEYINTGTWADIVRFPDEALEDSPSGRATLAEILGELLAGGGRTQHYTYATVDVTDDGNVERSRLEVWTP